MQENFWKNKDLVKKTVKQKKNFEDILISYKKSQNDINNIKDLFDLATQEKDDQTINDCNLKIEQIQNTFFLIRKFLQNCKILLGPC